jgi:hypothetical protein
MAPERGEWLEWSVPRDGKTIVVPKGVRFVKILGPGSAQFARDTNFAAIKAILILNVHLNIYKVDFENVEVLAALNMSYAKASGYIPEKWIFPPDFPSLKHFLGDGCAPEMQSHCLARNWPYHEAEDKKPFISSTVVEAPYAMNMNVRPEAPCRLVLPVTRRVQGLSAYRVVLKGSDDGWHAEVHLDRSEVDVLGTNPQLFWQFHKEERITTEMELEAAKWNMELWPEMQQKCEATQNAAWDRVRDLQLAPEQCDWGSESIASVAVDGVQVGAECRGFVLLKALFELGGSYLMSQIKSLGFDPRTDQQASKKKRKWCDEYAKNKNLTIEWTTQPLAEIRASLAQEFDKVVEQVCGPISAEAVPAEARVGI